jgi:ubiquinone/menaquinone biosynthesis C-methylase UbiE
MGLWSDRVLPHVVDKACGNDEIAKLRVAACEGLEGRVLEIGFGSGLNIPVYPEAVKEVAAVEPSDVAWRMSEQRRERSGVHVERSGLDGQCLLEQDGSCDSALSTFTLCTIPDAIQALREVRRVLRPGGSFHFVEHGRAPSPRVQAWQRRLQPMQRRVFGGCQLTRHVPSLLAEAGFEIVELDEDYLPGPAFSKPFTYGYVGRAVPA